MNMFQVDIKTVNKNGGIIKKHQKCRKIFFQIFLMHQIQLIYPYIIYKNMKNTLFRVKKYHFLREKIGNSKRFAT